MFDPNEPFWNLNVTIKLPDGTRLIADHVHLFYFSGHTAYGETGPDNKTDEGYKFAYRPDIGFAVSDGDHEKYHKLKDEAGVPLAGVEVLGYPTNSNLLYVYSKLIEIPAYRREYCPLDIIS